MLDYQGVFFFFFRYHVMEHHTLWKMRNMHPDEGGIRNDVEGLSISPNRIIWCVRDTPPKLNMGS